MIAPLTQNLKMNPMRTFNALPQFNAGELHKAHLFKNNFWDCIFQI